MNKGKQGLSRSQILLWINQTLNINQTRIQNLGTGVVYCMLIHHFYPLSLPTNKVINLPRSPVDYRSNLKKFQQALINLNFKISFDIFKVAQMTYIQNWTLITKLHKILTQTQKSNHIQAKDNRNWSSSKMEHHFSGIVTPSHISTITNNHNISTSVINLSNHTYHSPEINMIQNPINIPLITSSTPIINNSIVNPLSTPMKGFKIDQGGKSRWQTINTIQQIKRIVTGQNINDKVKVSQLKKLLNLNQDEGGDSQGQLKDLLSDYKKKQQVITID